MNDQTLVDELLLVERQPPLALHSPKVPTKSARIQQRSTQTKTNCYSRIAMQRSSLFDSVSGILSRATTSIRSAITSTNSSVADGSRSTPRPCASICSKFPANRISDVSQAQMTARVRLPACLLNNAYCKHFVRKGALADQAYGMSNVLHRKFVARFLRSRLR